MSVGDKIYEGKAKILRETEDPLVVIQDFKDDATAFNALKKGTIRGKGKINCTLSTYFFSYLSRHGIPTHFLSQESEHVMKIKRLQMIPLEVVMRNIVAGSLAKRTGLPEGQPLPKPVLEWYYKRDDLGDPIVNRDHIRMMGLASDDVLRSVESLARRINDLLAAHLLEKGILLVDMKLEFGTDSKGVVLLGDEISGDTCRFWDSTTKEKMDKVRFRQDLGQVEEFYQEVFRRVTGHD